MSHFCHHVTNNHSFLLIFTEYSHIRTPFEVQKEAVHSNSLSTLLQKTPGLQAIRYSMRPYKEQETLTNVPLYAVLIREEIKLWPLTFLSWFKIWCNLSKFLLVFFGNFVSFISQ